MLPRLRNHTCVCTDLGACRTQGGRPESLSTPREIRTGTFTCSPSHVARHSVMRAYQKYRAYLLDVDTGTPVRVEVIPIIQLRCSMNSNSALYRRESVPNPIITRSRSIVLLLISFAFAFFAMLVAFFSSNTVQAAGGNYCSEGNGSYAAAGECAYSPGSAKEYCGLDAQGDSLW